MAIWTIPRPDPFSRRRRRHVSGSIRYDDPRTMRSVSYEDPGAVDAPFDRDAQDSRAVDDNPTCAVPWLHEGYEAIEVYVDSAVGDRATEVCEAVNVASGASRDLDTLTETVFRALEKLRLSPSLCEHPPDDLSAGVLAVGVTVGQGSARGASCVCISPPRPNARFARRNVYCPGECTRTQWHHARTKGADADTFMATQAGRRVGALRAHPD